MVVEVRKAVLAEEEGDTVMGNEQWLWCWECSFCWSGYMTEVYTYCFYIIFYDYI